MRILAFVLLAATAPGQTSNIIIGSALPASSEVQPKQAYERARRAPSIGMPIVGYVMGPGPVDIRPILGTVASAHAGDLLRVPEGAARLYLPPKQRYALVEQSSEQSIAVWPLGKASLAGEDLVRPISGALRRAALVAFSPRAESAVLYSRDSDRLQVISGLPFKPSVVRQISTINLGELSMIAVTDDATLVVAGLADGVLMSSSDGARWRPLPAGYTPQAWSFVPNTHDLVISDTTQKLIVLLPNAAHRAASILAEEVRADRLVLTRDGQLVVAADSINGNLWAIELKTGVITPISSGTPVNELSSLEAARAFLLSSSPLLSVVKLAPLADDPASVQIDP